jgi:hypothetical protein
VSLRRKIKFKNKESLKLGRGKTEETALYQDLMCEYVIDGGMIPTV